MTGQSSISQLLSGTARVPKIQRGDMNGVGQPTYAKGFSQDESGSYRDGQGCLSQEVNR